MTCPTTPRAWMGALQRLSVQRGEVLRGGLAWVHEGAAVALGALDELRDPLLGHADLGQAGGEPQPRDHPADVLGQRVAHLLARAADLEAEDLVDVAVAVGDRLAAGGV